MFTKRVQFIFLIPALVVLMSCTSANPTSSGKSSPAAMQAAASKDAAYTLEIMPHNPTRKTTLSLIARGFALSEAEVTWYVNEDMILGSGWNQIAASGARRGDTIYAQAIFHNQKINSNVVRMEDAPPEIASMTILPPIFRPGDRLHVEAIGKDDDGDAVTYQYVWLKNGLPAGTGSSMELPFKRGDKISVTVTPFDGQVPGESMVYEREIQNAPPVIIDHSDFSFDGTTYTYQVTASDPDGDSLTYALKDPEGGTSINASSGLLTWVVPDQFKGAKDISVTASDGQGGIAQYRLSILIQ